VDDAGTVNKVETLKWETGSAQISLVQTKLPWLGTEAKPKADQGQDDKTRRRTLLKSAIIFHTLASSNRGNVLPYSQRK
jgi:hypothetical protein